MKKAASALVLTGALTFLGAGAAMAVDANYPAPPAAVTGTVSAAVVAPGGSVAFSGTGFTPGEIIDVTVDYDNNPNVVAGTGVNGLIILNQRVSAFTATAGADGSFSTQVTLGEEGTYTLTAVGRESGRTVTATVAVDKSAAAGAGNGSGTNAGANAGKNGGLADTGADSSMLLWGAAGVLALGAGAVTVGMARRKKA